MGRWLVTCTCIIYKALHLMLQALRHCRRIESELGTYLPITVGCSATDKTGHSELKV